MRWLVADTGKRILITGSAGFLGEATLDRLTAIDDNTFVVALDTRLTRGPMGETRRFISVVSDLRQPLDDLLTDYEIDSVIHLAFLLRPPRDLHEAYEVNVTATRRLLEACDRAGSVRQVVYLSSATVYGAHASYVRPYVETDPPNPVLGFSYSEHKKEAEALLNEYAGKHPECAVAILRACVITGPGADNFITDSLGMRFLPVPAGANPEMQFLQIYDYADALQAVVNQHAAGTFNIAGSGTVKWREMIEMAGSTAIPAPAPLLEILTDFSWKTGLQQRSPAVGLAFIRYPWLVDTGKIQLQLGWHPQHTSRETFAAWAASRD
jgi:UDP-glucose 4-epimerase